MVYSIIMIKFRLRFTEKLVCLVYLILGSSMLYAQSDSLDNDASIIIIDSLDLIIDSTQIDTDSIGVVAVVDSPLLDDYYDKSLAEMDSLKAFDMDSELEKMINATVNVTSKDAISARYAPGVVSVITKEEIHRMGARDLIDVLRHIPGFSFGLDLGGRVGLGIRGNWANEGKVLLLIDGTEMNEVLRSNLRFGNHYPVEFIERIEVIRGPGSVIYGGFAEYAVINIITLSSEEFSGTSFKWVNGWMGDTRARNNRYFYIGGSWKNFAINFSTLNGEGQRSDRDYFSFFQDLRDSTQNFGAVSSLADQSDMDPNFNNFYVRLGKLSYRSILDLYKSTDLSVIDSLGNRPVKTGLRLNFHELKYEWEIKEHLTLTPKLSSSLQFPEVENATRPDSVNEALSDNFIRRYRATTTINFEPSHRINLLGGVEINLDRAENTLFENGVRSRLVTSYLNVATYAQAFLNLPQFYLTTGLRFDYNDTFGSAFAPRVALSKRWNNFHIKLLASGAFRAPTVGNVALFFDEDFEIMVDSSTLEVTFVNSEDIEPEYTFVLEGEIGYQIGEHAFLTANFFDITNYGTIVYGAFQDSTLINTLRNPLAFFYAYTNEDRSGSFGAEFEFKFVKQWGYLGINYAYYTTAGQNVPASYSVSTFNPDESLRTTVESDRVLGLARHRVNAQLYLDLSEDLSLGITANFYGSRFGYVLLDPLEPPEQIAELVRQPDNLLVNVNIQKRNFLINNLDLGIGLYNIFDERFSFYQPYFGVNPPLPGYSREFGFKLAYKLNFN